MNYNKGDLVERIKYNYKTQKVEGTGERGIVVGGWEWEGEPGERLPEQYATVLIDGQIKSIKEGNLRSLRGVK